MGIIVKTHDGRCIVRPDSILVTDSRDAHISKSVNAIDYTPLLYARISGSGGDYDGIGFGVLLYCTDAGSGCGHDTGNDHEGTGNNGNCSMLSYLPGLLYNPVTLGAEGNAFELGINGVTAFRYTEAGRPMLDEAVSRAVQECSGISPGDIVAVELAERKTLCTRGNSAGEGMTMEMTTEWCGNTTQKFKVIL